MEPAKLDDRELGCIDFFLFCCLLSSGLVWPTSWAILAPSWAILASSWTILAPSGAIRAPSWLPKASQSLPRLNQSFPRVIPEAPKGFQSKKWKNVKNRLGEKSIFGKAAPEIWRAYFTEANAKSISLRVYLQKVLNISRKIHFSPSLFFTFFRRRFQAHLAKMGGPSDTYPALQDAILAHGGHSWVGVATRELAWPLVNETTPPPISKTLVMVQSDPTRTRSQVILTDVR